MNKHVILFTIVFVLGIGIGQHWKTQDSTTYTATSKWLHLDIPATDNQHEPLQPSPINTDGPIERDSPSDWIKERQIEMRPDGVLIKINKPQWAILTNTNSMDPVFDETSHLIQIIPTAQEQINKGDIVSYQSPLGFMIVHRVVDIGIDAQGWYAIFKGDNNPTPDPWKVRWDMVKRVTIMIVY